MITRNRKHAIKKRYNSLDRLVSRKTDPRDRRRARINLTTEGNAIIREIFPKHAEITEQVFSVLNETDCQQIASLFHI